MSAKPLDLPDHTDRPNLLWVCDLTYLKTLEGSSTWCSSRTSFSRFIVGFQLADNLRTDLVLDALEMAAHLRRPGVDAGLVAHSDRGSQLELNRSSQHRVFSELTITGDRTLS